MHNAVAELNNCLPHPKCLFVACSVQYYDTTYLGVVLQGFMLSQDIGDIAEYSTWSPSWVGPV